MGNIKGIAWKNNTDYLKTIGGPHIVEQLLPKLSPEDQKVFAKPILPIHWFDYSAFIRFMLIADKELGNGDMDILRKASIYAAHKDATGIYGIFLSMASPRLLIESLSVFWKQYNDCGKATAHWDQPRSGFVEVVDYPDIPLYHEADLVPYMSELLRISGCKNVKGEQTKCIARGDDCCILNFSW
jgi:hypothetical protein